MSRSNPTEISSHPCKRWLEWDGSNGEFRYYDKSQAKSISVGNNLTFILLDQLSTIKGWHDASDSGIYANEVRDIRQDVLVVKAFKGGTLAEGTYKSIRDAVIAKGAHFVANLYVAIKIDDELSIASVQFKGAALSAWLEFSKENKGSLYTGAVKCSGFNEGKKGKIVFRTPIFQLANVSPETDAKALDCDRLLQEFLKSYFSVSRAEQALPVPGSEPPEREDGDPGYEQKQPAGRSGFEDMDDDIPF